MNLNGNAEKMIKTKKILATLTSLVLTVSVANAQFNDRSQIRLNSTLPSAPLGTGSACGGTTTVYEQPLDAANFNNARTSDVETGNVVSESILNGAGVITPLAGGVTDSLRIWGLTLEFNAGFIATCLEDNAALTPFNVTFSADAGGLPGAAIATVTATPTAIVDTTLPFAFTTIFQWDLSFPATDITGAAWVTVERQIGVGTGGGNQCLFLWVDEDLVGTYDDSAIQDGAPLPSDQTICIGEAAPQEADLSITVTNDASQPIMIGDQFSYALAVNNAGPGDASGVTAIDTLSDNVTYVSNTCGAVEAGGVVTWAIGNLANGASVNCNINVEVSGFGQISNDASVSGSETDPTPANNTSNVNVNGQARTIPSVSFYGLILLALGLIFMVRRQKRA